VVHKLTTRLGIKWSDLIIIQSTGHRSNHSVIPSLRPHSSTLYRVLSWSSFCLDYICQYRLFQDIDRSRRRSSRAPVFVICGRSRLLSVHHASRDLTAMTYTATLLVLCVGAVLPTLAIKYTYEVKYLDVPVSKVQTGVKIVAFVGNAVLF